MFEGEQVKILSRQAADISDHNALLSSLVGPESSDSADDPADVLLRLAVSMRAHRRGGTLLVVPAGTEAWRESIVPPITYAVAPPFTELGDLVRRGEGRAGVPGSAALARVVDAVAGLTAVDGATLITDRFELLCLRSEDRPPRRPFARGAGRPHRAHRGGDATVVAPLELGGTRHISAAQFAQDQQDSVALVASQDGRFTVFAWSPREGIVHAHRVETLLL